MVGWLLGLLLLLFLLLLLLLLLLSLLLLLLLLLLFKYPQFMSHNVVQIIARKMISMTALSMLLETEVKGNFSYNRRR